MTNSLLHYAARMRRGTRFANYGSIVVIAAVFLGGCGTSNSSLTAVDTRHAFQAEGFPLQVVMDSRTLDQAQIDQLTNLAASDVGIVRTAKIATRTSLETIRARAAEHPVIWLATSSHPVNIGPRGIDVSVWGHTTDAEANEAKGKRGSGITGGSFRIERVGNVVIVYSTVDATTRHRVEAAVRRLEQKH